MENKNLLKISSYAKKIGVTPTMVYKLERQKKIKVVKIDGVKFVVLND